ncbi:MAG: hypothetical protein RBT49_04625 [Bacteroidales bacterium]|jgi:hypothetical protein|nr:hypothetical protein [Bacteroidales bacterium]
MMQDFNIMGLNDEKRKLVEFIPLSRKAKSWCESISMKGCICFYMEKPEAFIKVQDLEKLGYFFNEVK